MSKGKKIAGLDCEESSVKGIKLLLHARAQDVFAQRTRALDWSDIEGVHDMRVGSRRLRSALRDYRSLMKQRPLRSVNNSISRIADALGAVRDDDVAIAALDKLGTTAPPEVAIGIGQFVSELRIRRESERAALTDALAEGRLSDLQAEIAVAIEAAFKVPRNGKDANPQCQLSFRLAGRQIVRSRMKELQGFSDSLHSPFKSKPLHRMRIAAKRLRYALELFAQCYDAQLDGFSREVARLQTSLGELHDSDVWIAQFGKVLDGDNEANAARKDDAACTSQVQKRHASVWLLSYFTKRRTQHYRDALIRWHEWETSDFFVRLDAII